MDSYKKRDAMPANREPGGLLERFQSVCRERGVRVTHQRLEIFREVATSPDHPDAETVFLQLRRRIPTISLDTVYRGLWLLHDLGLIQIIGSGRESTRFDANLDPHHHFLCLGCGLMRDFGEIDLMHLELPGFLSHVGQVRVIHLEARGVCLACLQKEKKEAGS